MTRWMSGIAAFCMLAGVASAQEPIVAIKVAPEGSVFKNSAWDKPIILKSNTDAAKHFSKDALKTLETTVDFKKQFVLVFAWRGSGRDELSYNVAESYPEQISFSLKRGRTRDLRAHTKVYAVRSNVRWRAGGKPASAAKSVAQGIEAKELEVTVTPAKPYVLPDGSTKILVKKESIYLGRGGRTGTVQVMVGESVLDVVPRTVIATGGYRFEFNTAPQFQFGHVREEDMIFTVVDACTLTVLSSRQPSPRVALKELKDTVELACSHNMPCLEVHTIRGLGKHFVSFKPTMVEVARFHPGPPVLGARLKMNVINNFGAKAITLDYMKKTQVTIGAETITLESSDFDYKGKKLKIRITTVPKTTKAAATVFEYGGQSKARKSDDPAAATAVSRRAAALAKLFKANITNFTLNIRYFGDQDKPFYQLTLRVPRMKDQRRPFWPAAQLNANAARKVIDHLASDGFFNRAIDISRFRIQMPAGPAYTFWLSGPQGTQLYEHIGWGLPMLKRLDALAKTLDGDAAKKMTLLLGRLSGHRKEWTVVRNPYKASHKLLPSGLLGPVRLMAVSKDETKGATR